MREPRDVTWRVVCHCRGRSSFGGGSGGRGGRDGGRPPSNPMGWSSGGAGVGGEADKAVDDWFSSPPSD